MAVNQNQEQTSQEYFKTLSILHLGLTLGQVLFAVVAYFLVSGGEYATDGKDLDETFQLIVPMLVIGGVTGGMLLARNRLQTLQDQKDLKEKMVGYRSTLITKYALWEAPSLVGIVGYLLTGNLFYVGLSAVIIGLFLLNRPTRERAVIDLQLTPDERIVIENPAAIIT